MSSKAKPSRGQIVVSKDLTMLGIITTNAAEGEPLTAFAFGPQGELRDPQDGGPAWVLTAAESEVVRAVAARVALGFITTAMQANAEIVAAGGASDSSDPDAP